jgi:hypothetical protein
LKTAAAEYQAEMRRALSDSPGISHDWTGYCGDSTAKKTYVEYSDAIPPSFTRPVIEMCIVPINIHALMLDPITDPRAQHILNSLLWSDAGLGAAPPAGFDGHPRGL